MPLKKLEVFRRLIRRGFRLSCDPVGEVSFGTEGESGTDAKQNYPYKSI